MVGPVPVTVPTPLASIAYDVYGETPAEVMVPPKFSSKTPAIVPEVAVPVATARTSKATAWPVVMVPSVVPTPARMHAPGAAQALNPLVPGGTTWARPPRIGWLAAIASVSPRNRPSRPVVDVPTL